MAVLMTAAVSAGIPVVVSFAAGGMLVLSNRLAMSTEQEKAIDRAIAQADLDD